jgi:hemerythrin-like metal-binding protein
MTLFHWRDSLSLDVPAIDDDHKRLIDLLNRLHFMVLAGDDREAIGATMWELVRYTQRHFRREEMLMRLSGYPGYEAHKRLHKALTERVMEYYDAFQAKPSRFNVKKLYDFLADWLLVHITKEDMRLQPYVARLGSVKAA